MLTDDDDEYYRTLFWKELYDTREGKPWSELQHTAERTTTIVRELVRSLVANKDRINSDDLEILFRLCQNTDDGISIDERRDSVQNLDLPSDEIARITEQIERPMGSVGSAVTDLDLEVGDHTEVDTDEAAQLQNCFKRLIDNVDPINESELLDAAEDLIQIDFRGVQSGRMSPILHYLAPGVFPIINGRSKDGMERCFDADIGGKLVDYLDEQETYVAVRDEFGFKTHFRDLDWFFNWVGQDDNLWTTAVYQDKDRHYWQAQPGPRGNNHPEDLWPRWQEENVISMSVGYGPISSIDSFDEIGEIGRMLIESMSPGDLVVAKAGHWNLLGIGVVTSGGFEYRTVEEDGIEISNQDSSSIYQDIRHVEWIFTVPAGDWINIEDWDMSKRFDNRTIISYNCFHELRYKLLDHFGDEVLDDLKKIEQRSISYLPKSDPEPRDIPELPEPVTETAPYYWVNQGEVEIENEYLRAPTKDLFQYDLPKLEVGDIVFSYTDGEVVGYHEVVEPARVVEISGDEANSFDGDNETVERYRVETTFTYFSDPLAFAEVFPTLWEHRLEQYYPVNPGGINQQYLFNLSKPAGEYLLREGMGGVEQYDGITEAEKDVRERLDEDSDGRELLTRSLVTSRIEEWTAVLRRNDFVEGSVRRPDYETVAEIQTAYETNSHQLSELATRLGIGRLGDCSPGQVLFLILFRDLQREAGVSEQRVNLNHVKLPHILNETYLTEDTIPPVETPPEEAAELRRQLTDKGQLVFHGPPGTGKTYTAKQFARWWLRAETDEPRAEQLETVTFHPSFTYEDFIEGLEAREQNGAVEYRVEPGIFRTVVDRATAAYEETADGETAPPYLLIIDEINRGNLAQIFGETITLLEQDKRLDAENETIIRLPHSGEQFTIPPNLYVIGTMNTADRSIALVDAALRRRFRFVHFPPSIETLCEQYGFSDYDAVKTAAESASDPARQLLALSICAVDELNRQIRSSPDLGRGKQLGHTSLLGIDQGRSIADRQQAITDRWQYEIMPMLEEYYFGQFDRIDDELFKGEGDRLFDTEAQEIRDFDADDLVTVCSQVVTDVEVGGSTSAAAGD